MFAGIGSVDVTHPVRGDAGSEGVFLPWSRDVFGFGPCSVLRPSRFVHSLRSPGEDGSVTPSDRDGRAVEESLHPPGQDPLWSESHYFDFVGAGAQGHVRIGFYPNLNRANAWVYLFLDGTRHLGWHSETIPLRRTHGTALEADGRRMVLRPLRWNHRWRFSFSGDLYETEAGLPPVGRGNPTVPVELELTLEGTIPPFFYSEGHGLGGDDRAMPEGTDRYEQPVRVEGTVRVDEASRPVDGFGERDHSWGPRDWFDMNWIWCSGRFEDGSAFNLFQLTDFEDYVNGFWHDGTRTVPLRDLDVTVSPDPGPGLARAWSRGDTDVAVKLDLAREKAQTSVHVDPAANTPILWDRSDRGTPRCVGTMEEARMLFNRSVCWLDRSGGPGHEGTGYLEYGQQITS